jgi:hypothetical protein
MFVAFGDREQAGFMVFFHSCFYGCACEILHVKKSTGEGVSFLNMYLLFPLEERPQV